MKNENEHIRRLARTYDIRHWQICKELDISEPTLTRWLRKPLPADKEQQILQAIDALKGGAENE